MAKKEFEETCAENDMLMTLKREQEAEQQRRENLDLDSYFRKKEAEEEERQRQIADRYNTCRIREQTIGQRIDEIDSQSTFIKKSEAELDADMEEAAATFDQKEARKQEQLEEQKRRTLRNLQQQMVEKDQRRAVELNSLLQTVGDMRDAVREHERDANLERMYQAEQKRNYGEMLINQRREADKAKKEFVRGMTPNERRINLPLLEKLRDTCAAGPKMIPTSRTVTPFSERSSSGRAGGSNNLGGQHLQAAKIRKKMKGDTIKFG